MGDPWDQQPGTRYDPGSCIPSSEHYAGYEFAHNIEELAMEVRASVIRRLQRDAPKLLEAYGPAIGAIAAAVEPEVTAAMKKWLARAALAKATGKEG